MQSNELYVELVLPVPLDKTFTYVIPAVLTDEAKIGKRVVVSFGRIGILTGIIFRILESEPAEPYQTKEIIDMVDDDSIIVPYQHKLLSWMSKYYLSSIGIVLKTFLPSGFRFSSESKFQLSPNNNLAIKKNNDDDAIEIIEFIKENTVASYNQINKFFSNKYKDESQQKIKKKLAKVIQSLVIKDIIIPFDSIKDKYTPKMERRFRLTSDYLDKKTIEALIQSVNVKQQDILMLYLGQIKHDNILNINALGMPFSKLKERNLSVNSYKTLKKYSIIEEFTKVMPRFPIYDEELIEIPALTYKQQIAYDGIKANFSANNRPILLYGKTGTGKTIIYMHLIEEMLNNGKQVLLLSPEIALTTHLMQRLKQYFGTKMAVYHSRFSDNERVEIWKGVLEKRINFVLGVRSSLFLPFKNLGLIIVDECHDASYKQKQQSPFYNTITVCEAIKELTSCQLLYGTGTPEIGMMYRANNNDIAMITIEDRYGQGESPGFTWVDLKKSTALKTLNNAFDFSTLERINSTIKDGRQVIVFQNRRGYSPKIRCESCLSSPKCPRCDVYLAYHLSTDELLCHYCGYRDETQNACQYCGASRIKTVGYGTEKLVEDLNMYINDSKVLRLDSDVASSKYSYDKIIRSFSSQESNILVGTQMVIKGLDFSNAVLVVVVNSDYMLTTANYRAHENTFQTISQLIGRVGRADIKGEVIIQTYNPNHIVYKWIETEDFSALYDSEIAERKEHLYPPFCKLILLEVKALKERDAVHFSTLLFNKLVVGMGHSRVFGPITPSVSKINLWYLRHLTIKLDNGFSRSKISFLKAKIRDCVDEVLGLTRGKSVRISINVDP